LNLCNFCSFVIFSFSQHQPRPNRQSAYYARANQNPNPWPPIGGQRHHTNYESNNLPDCPPEEMEDEELEFGNKEYYAQAQVNKFTNCAPAFPVAPYAPAQAPGPGNQIYPTRRSFQRLDQAPTKGPSGYAQQVQPTPPPKSSSYWRPPTPPPHFPPPETSTQGYREEFPTRRPPPPSYVPTEPPFRPYPTQATYFRPTETDVPYRPGPTQTESTYFRPTETPYRPGPTQTESTYFRPTETPYRPGPTHTESTYTRPTETPYRPTNPSESYISTKRYPTDTYDEKPTYKPSVTQTPGAYEPTGSPKPATTPKFNENEDGANPPFKDPDGPDYFDRETKSQAQVHSSATSLRPLPIKSFIPLLILLVTPILIQFSQF